MKMWVSGFEGNPDSPEYGKIVIPGAQMYSGPDIYPDQRIGKLIPHGMQVEVLEVIRDSEACRVQYEGVEGYIQFITLVDYDPAGGVRPHPLHS